MTTPHEYAKRKPLYRKAEWLTRYAEEARVQGLPESEVEFLSRLAECGHDLSVWDRPFAVDVMDILLNAIVDRYGWNSHMRPGETD